MGRTSDAKQKLIDSAIELIHSRSYANVGVNELCQHSGVKKGSFYHFFPSKQELTLTALDIMAEEFERRLSRPALSQDLSFAEKIKHLMELSCQHQQAITDATGHMPGCPIGNLAVELSTQDEAIRLKVQHIFELFMNNFEQSLAEAVENGELPEMDTRLTAQSIMAYIEGAMLLSKTWNDPELIRRLARQIPQLITPVAA